MTTHHEPIEWCNVWIPNAGDDALPRALLIGDSITQGLYADAEAGVSGAFHLARLTTSRFLTDPIFAQELNLVLDQYPWTAIVVNNGLHGWAYAEDEYTAGLPRLIAHLRTAAPDARLIWAQSTRILREGTAPDSSKNTRVIARNAIAQQVMTDLGIPIIDRYALVDPHPEWFSPDQVHFLEDGNRALGAQTAEALLTA